MFIEELTKETVAKIMALKGEARGVVFKTDSEFVLREKGAAGLAAVEKELVRLGQPIKYQAIATMAFYPVGLRALSLLVIGRTFDFNEEKIKEMGFHATKVSLIIKLFVKYFFSIQQAFFKEAPKIWRRHWTQGKIEPVSLDEEGKTAVLRVVDFNLHPVFCHYLEGYFSGILHMLIKAPQIQSQETKCFFRGDNFHEYIFKW